jgi:hypothetical protein
LSESVKLFPTKVNQGDKETVIILVGKVAAYFTDLLANSFRLLAYQQYINVAIPSGLSSGGGAVKDDRANFVP